jgi:hypothetical protein
MLTMRAMAAAAICAGMLAAALPALASCDSIYNGSCKPIPAKDPPEPAAEPEKAAKPLQINTRRNASRKASRAERSAQSQRKRSARTAATQRVLMLRQRRADAMAARASARARDETEEIVMPLPPVRSVRTSRRASAAADGSSGEATDLGAATEVVRPQPVVTVPITSPEAKPVEQARPVPAASPAPIPIHTVSQNEVNEIDLAAAAASEAADQSWMRTLVLAFGGLLAVGSALRLFL